MSKIIRLTAAVAVALGVALVLAHCFVFYQVTPVAKHEEGLWPFFEAIYLGCKVGICLSPVLAFSLRAVPALRKTGRWDVHRALLASVGGVVVSVGVFMCLWWIMVVLEVMAHHILTRAENLAGVLPPLAAVIAVVSTMTARRPCSEASNQVTHSPDRWRWLGH